MNSCNFIGIIEDNIILQEENGVKYVSFYITVEEIRKSRHGEKNKIYSTLCFEAWDSGAESLFATCGKGTLIGIESSARYDSQERQVYFRVKNFKVLS